jgi:hypothetical protein
MKHKMGTKCKFIDKTSLSKAKKDRLMKHSDHHSMKHIKAMVKDMKKGKTFSQSHKNAMKNVGK